MRLSLRPVHGRSESLEAAAARFVEYFTVRLFFAVGKREWQRVIGSGVAGGRFVPASPSDPLKKGRGWAEFKKKAIAARR